jgi:hypothetical protein
MAEEDQLAVEEVEAVGVAGLMETEGEAGNSVKSLAGTWVAEVILSTLVGDITPFLLRIVAP